MGFAFDLMLSLFQPAEGHGDQGGDGRVLVVAGDLVAQVPPHAFDRVQFRRVLRQEDQPNTRVFGQPGADRLAGMKRALSQITRTT